MFFENVKKTNFEKSVFLHVGLKPNTARYRCRMNIIESALERVWTGVYNHKKIICRDDWKFLSGQNFRWVGLENLTFS